MRELDPRERESVLRDLRSHDEEIRRLAVERLGMLSAEEEVRLLVGCLGDSGWRVRKVSVQRLSAISDVDSAVCALIHALADGENPGRRNGAIEALTVIGRRALPLLLSALDRDDPDVRKQLVDVLAAIGDPESVTALVLALDDEDPNVRAATADALGAIGTDLVAAPLQALARREDEVALVRFSALRALAAQPVAIPAAELEGVLNDPILRAPALALLGNCDDRASVEALLKGLSCGSRSAREAAVRSLLSVLSRLDGRRADSLVDAIRTCAASEGEIVSDAIEQLAHADLPTRLMLLQFLGLVGTPEVAVPVLRAARDEALAQVSLTTLEDLGDVAELTVVEAFEALEDVDRISACQLFATRAGAASAQRLLESMDRADPQLRIAAADAIGRRALSRGLDAVVRCLEAAVGQDALEAEEEVAALTRAVIAIAGDGASASVVDRTVDLLEDRLSGADEALRRAIATVLGAIGRPCDSQVLSLLLRDPEASVRREAVQALSRLDAESSAEPLHLALADESPEVRVAAAVALGHSSLADGADDLSFLVGDADPNVRAAAVRAMGSRLARGTDPTIRPKALPLLEAALDDDVPVALAAAESLRRLGGADALCTKSLLSRDEPELVLEAVRCIGGDGGPGDLDALLPLVAHPEWSVRAEAIKTLGERSVAKAVPPILRRLEVERDEFVRDVTLRTLKRLEG